MSIADCYMQLVLCRCGNVAAILELDEHLQKNFTIFEAAPQVSCVVFSVIFICVVYKLQDSQVCVFPDILSHYFLGM